MLAFRIRGPLFGLLALLALAAIGSATALAQSTSSRVLSQKVAPSPRAAIDYWTPERLRAAQPLDPPVDGVGAFSDQVLSGLGSVQPQGTPLAIPGTTGLAARAFAPDLETNPANDTVYPQRIHGKIFMTLTGVGNFACSGTVTTSPLRNLIMTAGHCVFGAGLNNRFATNFVFIPGYRNGATPLGVWPATNLYTLNGWATGGGGAFASDIGAARLSTVNGNLIEDQLGSRGVAFNISNNQIFDIFGYPARPSASVPQDGFGDYDAERLIVCDKPSSQVIENLGDGPSIGAAYCFMQQGSSGGGWVTGTGNGFVNSVVSHGYCQQDPPGAKTTWNLSTLTGKCGIFFGPYFGDSARALYDLAAPAPPAAVLPPAGADPGKKKKKKRKKRKRKKRRR